MRKLLLFACALFGFMACTQNPIEEQSAIRIDAPETIRVGFEDDETRIQLNSAQKTVWTKDDLVSVFYKSDANQKWEYRGETGERVAELYRVDAGTASSKMNYVVLAYPYSADYVLSTASGNIEATLPATQHYAEGSYGVGSNLMVSQSEFTQFSLKSVCGWLKLQLTGDGAVVKSIKFRGNDGEQVAGLIYVDTATAEATLASEMGSSDDNNAGGNLVFDDTILTEVVLDCGEGITLGAEATSFYIALPPQTFANGFTVEIECDGYELMTLTTEKEFVIERNHIQPMASVEHNAEQIIPNNEIWYTNNSTTYATAPANTDAFGANIVSNTYDATKECWVIKFDGEVTTIGDCAFLDCRSLTSVTIPDSVTAIGYNAFYSCSSLTSVTIPDSVTTIGNDAFVFCESLTSVTIPDSVTTIGDDAFAECSSLESVTIPDSVITIGGSAFSGCHSLQEFKSKFASEDGRCLIVYGILNSFAPAGLTEYTIPDSVTTIGYNAFCSCSSLTSVTIPDNVTEIGGGAFVGCFKLQKFDGKIASEDGRCLILNGVLHAFAPDGITEYTIPNGVTTIGNDAFYSCSSLTSVTIPDSVTTIGEWAFYNCSSLTSITIPDSVTTIGDYAFHGCSSLTSVTIPDSVTTIGDDAFHGCSSLKKVYCNATIPPSLGDSAFSNNANGRRIYVYEECVEVYKSAWSSYKDRIYTNGQNYPDTTTIEYTTTDGNTITSSKLPIISNSYDNGVGTMVISGIITVIPNYAFSGCSSLTSVTIPDSVTTIGGGVFYGCSSLTSVTIPDSVTTIGGSAFFDCSSLTSVTIPDSVTTIGEGAFWGCSSLTSVTIPDSVTTIGEGAFVYCYDLTSVTIPDSVTMIGGVAFFNCYSLTSVTIPDSVTTIGENAFSWCESLTSVTIPDSVTTIGEGAFCVCSSLQEFRGKFASEDGRCLIIDGTLNSFAPAGLTEYTIPDSVTTIGEGAFGGCKSLTSVTIPDSVTTIGSSAFEACSSLTSVYCKAITPPAALISWGDWEAFDSNASNRKIYVPMESAEAYKSASGWSEYASAIVGYDF